MNQKIKNSAGRPEYGRKLINPSDPRCDVRLSRSIWTTPAELQMLKMVMEIFKNDTEWEKITIADVVARYLKEHPEAELEEHEKNYNYTAFHQTGMKNVISKLLKKLQ